MWTRTENQAKHILLNRTRDGMRVQVNVFLMKENYWRLSLGGIHHSIPQMFSNWRWQSAVWPQSFHLFPSSAVSVWSNNDSLSKLLLRSLSSEAGLCIRWKWLLLPWSLDKFCYKLEAVCMHIALMAGWSAGWWGGDSSEQQQSPQALLFCLTLSRTHTTWCPHRARLCTRGCVCVSARSLL